MQRWCRGAYWVAAQVSPNDLQGGSQDPNPSKTHAKNEAEGVPGDQIRSQKLILVALGRPGSLWGRSGARSGRPQERPDRHRGRQEGDLGRQVGVLGAKMALLRSKLDVLDVRRSAGAHCNDFRSASVCRTQAPKCENRRSCQCFVDFGHSVREARKSGARASKTTQVGAKNELGGPSGAPKTSSGDPRAHQKRSRNERTSHSQNF